MRIGVDVKKLVLLLTALSLVSCLAPNPPLSPPSPTSPPTNPSPPSTPSASLPQLPTAPVIPDVSVNVGDYGAIPNDGKDDTAQIQAAINAIHARGGGSVLFAPGQYDISINQSASGNGRQKIGLRIYPKLRLSADPGHETILRVADAQGNYSRMLGTFGEPLEDFELSHLSIDGNGQNNPVLRSTVPGSGRNTPDFDDGNSRFALAFYGHRVRVASSRFTNQNSGNVIALWGNSNDTSDVEIVGSRFENIGGGAANYDHSTVYTSGARVRVANNTFSSRNGPGTLGAVCAIEVHDSDQLIEGNTVDGYIIGANVVGDGATNKGKTNPASERQLYRNNTFKNVKTGFYVWSYLEGFPAGTTMLKDVDIHQNTVELSVEAWSNITADQLPIYTHPQVASAGVVLVGGSDAPIEGLSITDNTFKYVDIKPISEVHDLYSSGVQLFRENFPDVPIGALRISGNRIENAAGPAIHLNARVIGNAPSVIENNVLVNPARSIVTTSSNTSYRSAVYVIGQSQNLSVQNNQVQVNPDTTPPLNYGLNLLSSCSGNCTTQGNTVAGSSAQLVKADSSWTVR